ncbi:hypothetical protein ACFOLJ_23020 [Rugamonas sp. CCM 8940]|uniref:hypothetical protein n=1 Tax=Rugamonas sp. CCM 8940 TaxID=2765359 RepID=UPI0018F33EE7|nr:hypothetical protein [Rugamonas sp. CCM 8940]MBJ7312477.1 hypothetical protein [Rugamonas sp. CCM 8940]
MQLHLLSARWTAQRTDWLAAAVAGFGGGGVLMLLELFWTSVVQDGNPWPATRMVAAIAMGGELLRESGFSLVVVATALALHYALGTLYGLLLVAIVVACGLEPRAVMASLAGVAFGLLLYIVNFYGVAQAFPWFTALRGAGTAAAHAVFGVAVVVFYLVLERPAWRR